MKLRTPLVVTAAGALIIGGVGAGTTLAAWQDQEPLPAASVGSGSLEIEVRNFGNTEVHLGEAELTVGGPAKVATARVVNASAPGARHLRYDLRYVGAANATGVAATDLQIALAAKGAGDCTPAESGFNSLTTSSPVLNSSPIEYEDFLICVSLRAVAGAGSEGEISLEFEAVQVQ